MRTLEIIQMLDSTAQSLPVVEIANRLGVSKRSVQDDLRHIRQASAGHGFNLVTHRGQGISLDILDRQAFERYIALLDDQTEFGTVDAEDIFQSLLDDASEDGFLSSQELADIFGVGRNAIFAELDRVEEMANQSGVILERERSRGIRLTGYARAMKQCLARLLLDSNSAASRKVSEVLPEALDIKDIVLDVLHDAHLEVEYPEYLRFSAFAAATLFYAMRKRNDFNSSPDVSADIPDGITAAADLLCSNLAKIAGYATTHTDREDFIWILRQLVRVDEPLAFDAKRLDEDLGDFFAEYDKEHGTSYFSDSVLRTMLLTHLTFLIERLSKKISYSSNCSREFEITHPDSMNVAIRICSWLGQRYGVVPTHDETALVACHLAAHDERVRQQALRSYARIAVVCSTGGGGSYLVRLQFESVFPTAEIKTFSYQQHDDVQKYNPDLVFSMVPFQLDTNIPIVYIHEMLDQKDLAGIRESVRYGNLHGTETDDSDVWSLISSDCFRKIDAPDYRSYEDVLEAMGYQLEDEGYGQRGFTGLVLKRESFSSTRYLNGVCIPHPLETEALKDAISAWIPTGKLRSDEHELARVIFMICLTRKSLFRYQQISKRLYQLMLKPELVDRVAACGSARELRLCLKEMEGVLNA